MCVSLSNIPTHPPPSSLTHPLTSSFAPTRISICTRKALLRRWYSLDVPNQSHQLQRPNEYIIHTIILIALGQHEVIVMIGMCRFARHGRQGTADKVQEPKCRIPSIGPTLAVGCQTRPATASSSSSGAVDY